MATFALIAVGCIILFFVFPLGNHCFAGPNITVPPLHRPLLNDDLLRMIELTEDWDHDSIGAAGEGGPWQMLPETWAYYCERPMPYSEARWRLHEAQFVLYEHANWIRYQLIKHDLPDNPYYFALVWKAGWGRVLHNRPRQVDIEYARRARNNYEEITK